MCIYSRRAVPVDTLDVGYASVGRYQRHHHASPVSSAATSTSSYTQCCRSLCHSNSDIYAAHHIGAVCVLAYNSMQRVGRLPPNFQDSSGAPQGLFQAQNLEVWAKKLTFSSFTGVGLLGVLGSPSLQPWAASALAWPDRWTRDTLRCLIERSHPRDGGFLVLLYNRPGRRWR